MQRRKGLATASSTIPPKKVSEPVTKHSRGSDSDSLISSSDSEDSSSLSDGEKSSPKATEPVDLPHAENREISKDSSEPVPSRDTGSDCKGVKRNDRKKKDYSDESKWKKMKVKGSEQEIMVDVTRVQKYVDYDSAVLQTIQSEVKQAKGNFRQQMADYSDL